MKRHDEPEYDDASMTLYNDLLAWLDAQLAARLAAVPVPVAVRTARLLAGGHTEQAISAHADNLVYELTRQKAAAEVAKDLGTSVKSVNKAVARALARRRAERSSA